jgi:hypothetical protein
MRNLMRTTTLLAFIVFGATAVADAQVSFGSRATMSGGPSGLSA